MKSLLFFALLASTMAFADQGDDDMIQTASQTIAISMQEGTPAPEDVARIEAAKAQCENLSTAEQCYNGFYLVWGVGGDLGLSHIQHVRDNATFDFTAHLGISFFDVLDIGAEGGLIWAPLAFTGLEGGVYAKLQPIKWVYLKGHYYWVTGKGPADFTAPSWGLELGTRLNSRLYGNDFTRGYFGVFYEHNTVGMNVYGVRFTLEGGMRMFTVWKEKR